MREVEIVDIAAVSSEKPRVLDAPDRLTDPVSCHYSTPHTGYVLIKGPNIADGFPAANGGVEPKGSILAVISLI